MNLPGETICPYCGVGCRLQFDGEIPNLRVRGVPNAAANLGGMCAKGAQLGPTIAPGRLSHPQIRLSRKDGFRTTSWDESIRYVAEIFRNILHAHGPEAIAFYGSGQLDTEAVYSVVKLFKGRLGCNNTDSNSRLCMAAAAAGYKTSLGSDGPPTCYEDIDHAGVIVISGSNMAEAHPVTFDRVKAAKKARPDLQIVVLDPRLTLTAQHADLHVPVAPGGDIPLFNALARMLIERNAPDHAYIAAHTSGFDEFRRYLLAQDLDGMLAAAGTEREPVERLADLLARKNGFLSFYCMGLNQSTVGMWKNNSIINLHLLLGQIGKPGAGPFSLTGQPNAMGGREVGLLAHQLPGYRFTDNAEHRAEVERHWQTRPGGISAKPGLTAIEMFRALERGQLKAIWIAGTNPAVSMPDLHQVRRGLEKAQLVVVQDAYEPTETGLLADVLLPASQFGEKAWTSTNSERMVSFSPKLWDAPGEALPDWEIVCRFARALGLPGFDFKSSGEIWNEFVPLTAGRPCDMAGITHARLRQQKEIQWPCPTADHPGSKRRYEDGRFPTPDGRAVFLPREHKDPREVPDHEFPFVLTTGRLYAHWHTLTRTAKVDKLNRREPGPFVEMHPDDAARLDLAEGDSVRISSRRGTIVLPARIREGASRGMVFMPFHWGDLYAPGNAPNYLTISAIGRVAKQPELKYCAVHLEKVPAPRTALEPVAEPARLELAVIP